ncbi:hypothetical protein M422DRAFT_44187 [Sphaerobolus stellatus SS14]|nr:hypothetical protein M422DRAFT_44187 [Sphaerobolus stellatus SS14]
MVHVTISARGRAPSVAKGLPISIDLPSEDPTVGDVKKAIAKKFPRFYPDRQKLSLKGDETNKALSEETKLSSLGITSTGEINAKDLGPQISWKTVFLIEYGGPLVIHPIFYHFPALIYGRNFEHSTIQKFIYAMVMAHFVKRELETLFIHRFSHSTMPFRNVFKNSAHYHLGSGLAIAWAIYGPSYGKWAVRKTIQDEPKFLWAGFALWAIAELCNLHAHVTLSNLRPPGSKVRAIPRGFGFDLVSFPNYFWETVGWAAIAGMTNNIFVYGFLAISTGQMLIWALKKHRAYKREFGKDYPKGRKAMIPFIL